MRFAGYAALFDRPDKGGDVIRKGAFLASLGSGGPVPLLWQHRPGAAIGRIERLAEDRRGLRVIAELGDSEEARRAARLLETRAVDGLSFGYRVMDAAKCGTLRELRRLQLVEVSLVADPMQPGARVHAVEQAKGLVEQAIARRWRSADRIRLRLPPARLYLRPGDDFVLPGSSVSWTIQSIQVDGMAVEVEARRSGDAAALLPADPGRAVAEPDVRVGRSKLALFELPALGDGPSGTVLVHIAAACAGSWKALPVDLVLGAGALPGVSARRRTVMGHAEAPLSGGTALLLDCTSSVTVRLASTADCLFNADEDALMGGANLAALGDELFQFGRAEEVEPGLYRLSHLLRGRRGTEWAMATHATGDPFCLVDSAATRTIELVPAAVGAELAATSHGIADAAPFPCAIRTLTGEALRPPSPCHFALVREDGGIRAEWTRRSHNGWSWIDGIEVPADTFPERYRLTFAGPGGQVSIETAERTIFRDLTEVPASPGETLYASVVGLGPLADSREAAAILNL